MPLPTLFVHLIVDPTDPSPVKGDRSWVLRAISTGQSDVRQIDESRRSHLENAICHLEPLLMCVFNKYATSSATLLHPKLRTLDVLVFQAANSHLGAHEGHGVGGCYHDVGWTSQGSEDTSPNIRLSVLPGREERLAATAVHEFGHYLRSFITSQADCYKSSDTTFGRWTFEEGLSEHLVREVVGPDHVLHSDPITAEERRELAKLLVTSAAAHNGDGTYPNISPEYCRLGYRLGYHTVHHLLSSGRPLSELFALSSSEVTRTVLSWCES